MLRKVSFLSVLLIVVVLVAACGGSGGGAAPAAKPNTLTAVKVSATTLDPAAADWAKSPALEIATKAAKEGNPDGPVVKLQAIYDGSTIAIRSEWADDGLSIKKPWVWDGSAFSQSGDEDRILFTFPIQNNAEFASKGCTAACHNTSDNDKEWWMGSDDPALTYDAWQAKSTRTLPAGYVDDKWWGVQEDPADIESSRHGDAKDSGGEKNNATEDGSGPAFMSPSGPGPQPIMAAEAVALDMAKLAAGDMIYGYLLEKPTGSRGDIEANAAWADGKWVVVLRRALNTGHEDDVVFSPPKQQPFGTAVLNGVGGMNHTVAPEVLTLEWK